MWAVVLDMCFITFWNGEKATTRFQMVCCFNAGYGIVDVIIVYIRKLDFLSNRKYMVTAN